MKKIKWGMIGCGDVTEVKSGPAFQLANNSELVAVMRRNGKLAGDYAQRHNVSRWYDDARQLINDPDVDAVYVATPPSSHKEYTIMVAEAGKPVYVEKPMALNYNECREMIAACNFAGVPLFVAYYRRALPRFLTIKSMIENGEIGEVRGVHIVYHAKASKSDLEGKDNWRVQPNISGGGYFVDLACHTLDILQFYFGYIISADGNATNQAKLYPAEDLVVGNFIFSSGVYGSGLWSFSAHDHLDRIEIIGSRGKISFTTFGNSPVSLETSDGIKNLNLPNPLHIQQPLIQTIVDELNGVGKCPSTGLTAASTSKVMDRLLS
jgi:predicted dehydrogenase